MGRKPVRRVEAPRSRGRLDALVIVAAAIVLLFAVFGVASAGKLLADKVSGSNPTATPATNGAGNGASSRTVARANAQATAIVKAAQSSSRSIVSQATTRARHQAAAILTQAHRKAGRITAAASSRAAAIPTATPAPATSNNSGIASGTTGSTSSGTGVGVFYATATPFPVLVNTPVGAPNLSGVPASWRVVGYNATFGSGPGTAGSVSVVNRGAKPYSGTVRVVYADGGSATAVFSGLAPGQSEVLALNGRAYPGGGYTIQVNV